MKQGAMIERKSDTSLYVEKCHNVPPLRTASFYDREADLVFVETEFSSREEPIYECFKAGYWVVFKTVEQGFLSYLEIIVPKSEWAVERNLQVPNPAEISQVTFLEYAGRN